jgi:hypothetical protein
LAIINNSGLAWNVQIVVSDTGFAAPVKLVSTSGSGTWEGTIGSSLTLKWFADLLNGQGAGLGLATPGAQVDTDSSTSAGNPDAFAISTTTVPFITGLPFSMTEYASIALKAGGELNGFSMSEVATPAVPEPSTWTLMGLGFASIGLAGFYKKRQPRADTSRAWSDAATNPRLYPLLFCAFQ